MKRSYSLLLSLCLISKHRFSPGVRKSGFSFQSQSRSCSLETFRRFKTLAVDAVRSRFSRLRNDRSANIHPLARGHINSSIRPIAHAGFPTCLDNSDSSPSRSRITKYSPPEKIGRAPAHFHFRVARFVGIPTSPRGTPETRLRSVCLYSAAGGRARQEPDRSGPGECFRSPDRLGPDQGPPWRGSG